MQGMGSQGRYTYLLLKTQPLLKGVVQLRVGVAELLPAHETLETLAETWT